MENPLYLRYSHGISRTKDLRYGTFVCLTVLPVADLSILGIQTPFHSPTHDDCVAHWIDKSDPLSGG